MTETANQEIALKRLEEIDFRVLTMSLANALAGQVGGRFDVQLSKFEHTDHGQSNEKLILQFQIIDRSGLRPGDGLDISGWE